MKCPICQVKTKVLETRDKDGTIYRVRKCYDDDCKFQFNTKEMITTEKVYKS